MGGMTVRHLLVLMTLIGLAAPGRGQTLAQAAARGNIKALRPLLQSTPAAINARHSADGTTALQWAVRNGRDEAVQLLLAAGASPNIKDNRGYTALTEAIAGGRLQIAAKLFVYRADADATLADGSTPLILAILNNRQSAVTFLLEHGARAGATDGAGRTALHLAAARGALDAVRALLSAGADANARAGGGATPLHLACEAAQGPAALLLIDRRASPAATRVDTGDTPLHLASRAGLLDVIERLIAVGERVDVTANDGATPLCRAAAAGKREAAAALIAHGADVRIRDNAGRAPIAHAVLSGALPVYQLLLQSGADASVVDREGCGLVGLATTQDDRAPIFADLIQRGLPISLADKAGNTPLHLAALRGATALLLALLNVGADPTVKRADGETPLSLATSAGKTQVADILRRRITQRDEAAARQTAREQAGIAPVWDHQGAPTAADRPFTEVYRVDLAPGQPGAEWTIDAPPGPSVGPLRISTTPKLGLRFLGEFGNQGLILKVKPLPPHVMARVEFDLLILRTWDGNWQYPSDGPDIWSLGIPGGPSLLDTTFSLGVPWGAYWIAGQAFPDEYLSGWHAPRTGAASSGAFGYFVPAEGRTDPYPADQLYHMRVTFAHGGDELALRFAARGLENLANESWGITNVRVGVADISIASHAVTPGSVRGVAAFDGKVTLAAPTPVRLPIRLKSDNPLVQVPVMVQIPAGGSEISYSGAAQEVGTATSVHIVATAGGAEASSTVALEPRTPPPTPEGTRPAAPPATERRAALARPVRARSRSHAPRRNAGVKQSRPRSPAKSAPRKRSRPRKLPPKE